MTKADLIQYVFEKSNETLTKKQVEMTVNLLFNSVKIALERGERVDIRGFGNFVIRKRNSKTGRNPKTGETVKIPSKKVPFFKVGKEMRDMVNKD